MYLNNEESRFLDSFARDKYSLSTVHIIRQTDSVQLISQLSILLPHKGEEVTKAERTFFFGKVSSLSLSLQAQNPFVKSRIPFKWELFFGVIFCTE